MPAEELPRRGPHASECRYDAGWDLGRAACSGEKVVPPISDAESGGMRKPAAGRRAVSGRGTGQDRAAGTGWRPIAATPSRWSRCSCLASSRRSGVLPVREQTAGKLVGACKDGAVTRCTRAVGKRELLAFGDT